MALVLDTGVIYAALDAAEPDHERCVDLLDRSPEQLIIPGPVLVEVDYLVNKFASLDVWMAFCEDVRGGAYGVYPTDPQNLQRAAEIQHKFHDQPIGFVDASVVATCEALGEDKVATLDRRHFSILRTLSGSPLVMLPE